MPGTRHLRTVLALLCVAAAAWLGGIWRQEHRLAQAQDAVAAGHSQEARRTALTLSGPTVKARAAYVLALAALQGGDLRAAEGDVVQALQAAPNDWSLHRDHAVLLRRLGDRAGAVREIRRALSLNPRMILPPLFAANAANKP